MGKKIYWFSAFILILMLCGCATDYQILKEYQFVRIHDNLIAGIEPDEASRKILISETGVGIPMDSGDPIEQKLSAQRAAVLDAYRKIIERLGGMVVQANSNTNNGRLTEDQIRTIANAYLRGANVVSINYEEGIAHADVKVYIQPRREVYYHNLLSTKKW